MYENDLKGKDITSWFDRSDLAPFRSYNVHFYPMRELKTEHCCENGHIDIWISDYLKDAPYTVLQDVVWNTVQNRSILSESVRRYIRRDDFIENNRPLYMNRVERFTNDSEGKEKDLKDSIERIEDLGLISEADYRNSAYTWVKHRTMTFWGKCNLIFRVVCINPILDDLRAPDRILDEIVYHETLHLRQSTMGIWRGHDKQFLDWENEFPGIETIKAESDYYWKSFINNFETVSIEQSA